MRTPWSSHRWSVELDVALAAVREAAVLCRAVGADVDRGAVAKPDLSPVTVADFGSQALICRALGDAFADDPVIGEEDSLVLREPGRIDLLTRVTGLIAEVRPGTGPEAVCAWIDRGGASEYTPRFWTLDPIDGTKGFLRGEQYAIALALIIDGRLAVAAMGCPSLGSHLAGNAEAGTLFAAVAGGGAWQMPLLVDGSPQPLQVSREADIRRLRFCESVEPAHSSHDDAARVARHLRLNAAGVRLDSQTKYGVVARGEAEAYLRLPRHADYREHIWDHAAGALVVMEAGGRVTDITGRDLDFSRGSKLFDNRGIVVTNGPGHVELLAAIDALGLGS